MKEGNQSETLIELSSWQKYDKENAIKLIYGEGSDQGKEYVMSSLQSLNSQINKIEQIIKKHKINNIEIYDINNSIALIETCKLLNKKCIINITYPLNWMSNFAGFYFKYNKIDTNNVTIKYEEEWYKEEYEKLFAIAQKTHSNVNQLDDIKDIIDDSEIHIQGYKNNYAKLQEWASYLQNELNKYKESRSIKVILKINKIAKKIKISTLIKRCYKFIQYIYAYGIIKTLKKIGYKIQHYTDIPLWETEKDEHYRDLYEFKFMRYKKAKQESNISLKKLKTRYTKNLVSIVIPVYNGEDTLRESLDSIYRQTYKKFECIMVNDGSTDGSLKIMKEYAKKDSRFKLVDQKNGKLPKALNNGFKVAKGEFYTWTSCDNNMHPEYIERMVKQLKQDQNVDFIYADLKLINEEGNILRGFGWYEFPENSGNVILPTNINHLNIYPNNYIGAAFMYRSLVHKILSDYSENRYTVEDYDYWQRINSLLTIKKARLSEPLYYYRFHSKSLTAQASKLNINDKRDDMMLFDDYRRDYYLLPFCWVIDSDKKTEGLHKKIEKYLIKNGQTIIDKKMLNSIVYPSNYSNTIVLQLAENSDIKVKEEIFKAKIVANNIIGTQLKLKYTHINKNEYTIISSMEDILKTIKIIAKDYYAIQYEDYIYKPTSNAKDVSVVICTYNRIAQLEETMNKIIDQTENKSNYEILIINNNIESNEVEKMIQKIKEKNKLSNDFLRYYVAPIKGLSYARNVGMLEARGKYILYIDDDSSCDRNEISEIKKAFADNKNAGVVGGNIILRVPEGVSDIYLPEYSGLWSQYYIESSKYMKIDKWYYYPYGANIAIEKNSLIKVGGFRTSYGRKENNFAGGEEIVVSSLISKLHKDIIINPNAKVWHKVEKNRFSKEHIQRTFISGQLNWYRLYLDMYIDEKVTLADINYKIEKSEKIDTSNMSKIKRYYLEKEKESLYKLKEYFNEMDTMRLK